MIDKQTPTVYVSDFDRAIALYQPLLRADLVSRTDTEVVLENETVRLTMKPKPPDWTALADDDIHILGSLTLTPTVDSSHMLYTLEVLQKRGVIHSLRTNWRRPELQNGVGRRKIEDVCFEFWYGEEAVSLMYSNEASTKDALRDFFVEVFRHMPGAV